MSPMQRVRRGLVRSFQVTRLFPEMTPGEHVALAILQRQGRSGRLFGNFWSMPDVLAEAAELLATLGLDERRRPQGRARSPMASSACSKSRSRWR